VARPRQAGACQARRQAGTRLLSELRGLRASKAGGHHARETVTATQLERDALRLIPKPLPAPPPADLYHISNSIAVESGSAEPGGRSYRNNGFLPS